MTVDYFQGVVSEYLRADRAMFVNTECLLQLAPGDVPAKGTSWYCDVVAANFRDCAVYLCEVTYSGTLHALIGRLQAWSDNWPGLRVALIRDCCVPETWQVQPWVFIPEDRHAVLKKKLPSLANIGDGPGNMPSPRVTYLEEVVPWKYRSWDRKVVAPESDA
jgi:hypothetical protein